MTHARRGVALALAVALLAGCGDAGDPDSGSDTPDGSPTAGAPASVEPADGSGTAPDPCTLLTEDDVGDAAGVEVTDVAGPVDQNRGTSCTWSFPAGLLGEVTVTVWVGHEFYSPDTIPEGFEEVPGVGDEAHRVSAGPLCTMIFKHGEYVVQVLSSDAGDDACVGLAMLADSRI